MKARRRTNSHSDQIITMLKAALLGCILTAVMVLLLAITMKWDWVGMDQVASINTLIKAISACFIGFILAGKRYSHGWVIAGVAGVLYMVLAFAVFAILNGSFALSFSNVSDLLMVFACASCICIFTKVLLERKAQKS